MSMFSAVVVSFSLTTGSNVKSPDTLVVVSLVDSDDEYTGREPCKLVTL